MTHEQAEARLRKILECVMPLVDTQAEFLKEVGLKKCSDQLTEISLQVKNCIALIDRCREENKA